MLNTIGNQCISSKQPEATQAYQLHIHVISLSPHKQFSTAYTCCFDPKKIGWD